MKKSTLLFLGVATLMALPAKAITPNASGVYEISNATQLEEFAAIVNGGKNTAKAVLTSDIDMKGISHNVIGDSFDVRYKGEFDGQFHKISNLVMDYLEGENLALFGYVGGGAKISNMVMDSSCKFLGQTNCAAFVAQASETEEDEVRLTCLGNEATVHAYWSGGKGLASGIAGPDDGVCCYIFKNCYNTGEIRGAIVAAMSSKCTYCNLFSCWTTLTVKLQATADVAIADPKNVQRNLFTQYKGSYEDIPWTWNFTFNAADSGSMKYYPGQAASGKAWSTYIENEPWDDPNGSLITGVYQVDPSWMKTGALCWFLNNCSTENNVWGQDLGKDSYPTFLPGHGQVKQGDNFTFSNTGNTVGAGINEIEVESARGPKGIYTIQGVKVENANVPGLYIIDGKKVLVK